MNNQTTKITLQKINLMIQKIDTIYKYKEGLNRLFAVNGVKEELSQ